ncbi:unnamed protein product [Durusdinium trenchii]|uniref:Cytochrome c domain-containing protein n=1 Tax=Durusdinium trenchii TaxID=1381693 RepID=A0ABP0K3V7_9DINO
MGPGAAGLLLWSLLTSGLSQSCDESPEVGLLQQSRGLSPLDLARAKKVVPGPKFLAAHTGESNELLNKHLLRISYGKAKPCEEFSDAELDNVLKIISEKAHEVLQRMHEQNQHPTRGADWQDPRGDLKGGAFLHPDAKSKGVPANLLAIAQSEKKCYDAAMAFTHSVSDHDKKEIVARHKIPLLPTRSAQKTNSLLQEKAAPGVCARPPKPNGLRPWLNRSELTGTDQAGAKIFATSCEECHSGGVEALQTFEENVDLIVHGKGSMPGFEKTLTKDEVAEVLWRPQTFATLRSAKNAALPRRHLLGAIILSPAVGVPANAAPTPLPVAGSPKPMPPIGYGTCCRPGAKGEELVEGVKAYLAAGGRLIDTAQIYGNHEDIAEAIRQSGVKREELWITSKVRVQSCNTPEDVLKAVDTTLRQLDTKYVDLMLLHGGRWLGHPS